ncbi:MAG TPA: type II secretion system protein GspK [Verrucomicrobiae bacterium]|jgi:general secretion pathway protein K|nr:type II secretion system protein GspK [Verrucomicrobiae bacterium]
MTRPATDQQGFALMAVLLGLTLLTVVVLEFTFAMRLEASAGHAFKQDRFAAHLAEAAVQRALLEIASGATVAADAKGRLTFYRTTPGSTLATPLPALDREGVPLGAGTLSYRISDEEARLDLNLGSPGRLRKLLEALGVSRQARDVVVDSLEDWKDADELHRVNGAESDDYYLRLPVPYRARNGRLQDIVELRQIRGITAALYDGTAEKPGLAGLTTVHGRSTININTASAPVLAALGLPDAAVADIVQSRARAPYTVVPPRFAGIGLGASSSTFRIEAEGRAAAGRPIRIVAVVQRRSPQPSRGPADTLNALGLAVLAWRTGEIR